MFKNESTQMQHDLIVEARRAINNSLNLIYGCTDHSAVNVHALSARDQATAQELELSLKKLGYALQRFYKD